MRAVGCLCWTIWRPRACYALCCAGYSAKRGLRREDATHSGSVTLPCAKAHGSRNLSHRALLNPDSSYSVCTTSLGSVPRQLYLVQRRARGRSAGTLS